MRPDGRVAELILDALEMAAGDDHEHVLALGRVAEGGCEQHAFPGPHALADDASSLRAADDHRHARGRSVSVRDRDDQVRDVRQEGVAHEREGDVEELASSGLGYLARLPEDEC